MTTTTNPPAGWTPAVAIDLYSISSNAFTDALKTFKAWSDGQPEEPLPAEIQNGWCEIPPWIAEKLLRRNKLNRKVSLETVKKYARRMKAGEWKQTGQPGILSDGEVYDMQHRLYAGYFSGATFPCYMITDVPKQDDLFAYIDDMKPRTPADALYTAGSNGMSSTIAAAIKLAWRYENGALAIMRQPPIRSMDNVEFLNYARLNPDLGKACHDLLSNYSRTVAVIGNKGVAGFVAWKIGALHGHDMVDEFLLPLGTGNNEVGDPLDDESPILALRGRLLRAQQTDEELKPLHVLGLIIKAFIMHVEDQPVGKRGLFLRDNEKFPLFEDATPPLADAAE